MKIDWRTLGGCTAFAIGWIADDFIRPLAMPAPVPITITLRRIEPAVNHPPFSASPKSRTVPHLPSAVEPITLAPTNSAEFRRQARELMVDPRELRIMVELAQKEARKS